MQSVMANFAQTLPQRLSEPPNLRHLSARYMTYLKLKRNRGARFLTTGSAHGPGGPMKILQGFGQTPTPTPCLEGQLEQPVA